MPCQMNEEFVHLLQIRGVGGDECSLRHTIILGHIGFVFLLPFLGVISVALLDPTWCICVVTTTFLPAVIDSVV